MGPAAQAGADGSILVDSQTDDCWIGVYNCSVACGANCDAVGARGGADGGRRFATAPHENHETTGCDENRGKNFPRESNPRAHCAKEKGEQYATTQFEMRWIDGSRVPCPCEMRKSRKYRKGRGRSAACDLYSGWS